MISNEENECLRCVADQASAHESWGEYAQYCRDRESGLRRRAFQHLEKFLQNAKAWSFDDRSAFANWVCQRIARFGERNGRSLVPHTLAEQLVVPTLREWAESETTNSTPCRWMGMFFTGIVNPGLMMMGLTRCGHDAYALLREALRRDPNDDSARIRLIEMIIGDARFSCHHLPDYYIGEPKADLVRTAEGFTLLSAVVDVAAKTRLQSELSHASTLIDDWICFSDSGGTDFSQWCVDRGRTYRWVKAFYYARK